jgi:hypothetical protein
MQLLDVKTGKAWPKAQTNQKLGEIREQCRTDLRTRDEARGIVNGKLTTTIKDPNMDGKTKDVVDPVKQDRAHTGAEFNALLAKRWAEFCSEPRDLDAFIASSKSPAEEDLARKREAAAAIETSLKEEIPKDAISTSVMAPQPETLEPAKPKRGPGRPKKNETATLAQ